MKMGTLKVIALTLVLSCFAGPLYADRVDIQGAAQVDRWGQKNSTDLTENFSISQMQAYHNPQVGIYPYLYGLGMPSAMANSAGLYFGPGFDLAYRNWGFVEPPVTGSNMGQTELSNPEAPLPGVPYFVISDAAPSKAITVYAQPTPPPSQFMGGLSEDVTKRVAQGALPAPVPEPGTLLLLGSGLSLASMAIRRRMRKKSSTEQN